MTNNNDNLPENIEKEVNLEAEIDQNQPVETPLVSPEVVAETTIPPAPPQTPPVTPNVAVEAFAPPPPNPQYGFDPSAQQMQQGMAAKKTSKGPIIAIITVVSLLCLSLLGFFLIKGPLAPMLAKRKIEKDPVAALTKVFDNTGENIENTPSYLPSFDQFMGKSTDQELNVAIASHPDSYYFGSTSLVGASVDFRFRTDIEKKEAMLNFGFETPYFTIDNTNLYVSPDLAAVSIPTLYSRHDYITVNTNTFVADWNKSEYGESSYNAIPENYNLPMAIDNYFTMMQKDEEFRKTTTEISDEFSLRSKDITYKLRDKSDIQFQGEEREMFKFRVVVRGRDLEDALDSYATLIDDTAFNYIDSSLSSLTSMLNDKSYHNDMVTEYMYGVESVTDGLRDIAISKDAEMYFFVNKATMEITEVEIDRLNISSGGSSSASVDISANLVFNGKETLMDNMTLDITAEPKGDNSYSPENVRVRITREVPSSEDLVGARWEIVSDVAETEYSSADTITAFIDFSWDKEGADDNSMSLKIGAKSKSNDESYYATLRGKLVEAEGSFVLSDGKLSLMSDSTEVGSLYLDYSCKLLENGSITTPTNNSIDFFDVNWESIATTFADQMDTF